MTYGLPCVDLLFILVATLTALRGYRRSLLGLVFELGGGFIGLLAGVALGPRIADATIDSAGLTGVMISLLTVFVLLTVCQTVGYIVGQRFASLAHKVRLGSSPTAHGGPALACGAEVETCGPRSPRCPHRPETAARDAHCDQQRQKDVEQA